MAGNSRRVCATKGADPMKRMLVCVAVALAAMLVLDGCKKQQKGPKIEVEKIETYKANLPPVPKIPVPNVPMTYGDS